MLVRPTVFATAVRAHNQCKNYNRMGALCSSTRMVVTESYDMPGVSAEMAEQTFRDMEAAPSFVPHLLAVEFLRGKPSTVGACWIERRYFGGKVIVVRKTITKMADHPFTVNAAVELEKASSWRTPKIDQTSTFVITPLSEETTRHVSTSTSTSSSSSCSVSWTIASLSSGTICGKLLLTLCLPYMKKRFIAHLQEEMRCYYEEALRRTVRLQRDEK